MILTGKNSISCIKIADIDSFSYFTRPEEDQWKTEMLQHLVEERSNRGLDDSELEWLEFLCID